MIEIGFVGIDDEGGDVVCVFVWFVYCEQYDVFGYWIGGDLVFFVIDDEGVVGLFYCVVVYGGGIGIGLWFGQCECVDGCIFGDGMYVGLFLMFGIVGQDVVVEQ